MSYTATKWAEWLDRFIVLLCLVCLAIGMNVAQASDDDRLDREPGVVQTPFPPARLPVLRRDGVLAFDYQGTVAWSRYMVTETPPTAGRYVYVLTYINGPGGLRPVFLLGFEPAPEKE